MRDPHAIVVVMRRLERIHRAEFGRNVWRDPISEPTESLGIRAAIESLERVVVAHYCKQCATCGVRFVPTHEKQIHCGPKCRQRTQYENKKARRAEGRQP